MPCSCCCVRRYVAKLFRDFVFHSCDEDGAPVLDWGAVAEALNKADAGVPEKVGASRWIGAACPALYALVGSGVLGV